MDRRLGACRCGRAVIRLRQAGARASCWRECGTSPKVALHRRSLVGAPAPLKLMGGTMTDRSAAADLTRRRALTAFAAFAGGSGLLGACTSAAPRRGAATSPATAAEPATRGRPQAGPAPL